MSAATDVYMGDPDDSVYDAIASASNGYRPESLQDYGIKITTNKGVCDIIYRNESNGYYGGYLEIYNGSYDGFESITESN